MDTESSKLEQLKTVLRNEVAYYWEDIAAVVRLCGLGHLVSRESHQSSLEREEDTSFSLLATKVKPARETDGSIVSITKEAEGNEPASSEGTSPLNGSRLAQIVASRGKRPFSTSRTVANV